MLFFRCACRKVEIIETVSKDIGVKKFQEFAP
jgi:hypothetical protein